MMGLLKIFQPFRQWPEPQSSLNLDPVWRDLLHQEQEARRRHKRVEPIRRAKAERVHQLLRGRA
jgi:hypothetical protein